MSIIHDFDLFFFLFLGMYQYSSIRTMIEEITLEKTKT